MSDVLDVLVVGDGPGGLSAALFLAKAGLSVTVFGQDNTAMHAAYLYNYLGIHAIGGSAFQHLAREQVEEQGAVLRDERVTSARVDGEHFVLLTEDGAELKSTYLVLSEGKKPWLAEQLGLDVDGKAVAADREGRTSVDRCYAVGRMVRPGRSQAIISAGDGAAAAVDIVARHKGQEQWCDWDVPPKAD